MTSLGYSVSEPIRDDELEAPCLRKCMRCLGTGYGTPPRENRPVCPACHGEGDVPETHAWAGYEFSLDFTKGGRP